MDYYIVSPSGKISAVLEEDQLNYWLSVGFRQATEEEKERYCQEKKETIISMEHASEGSAESDVYIATVTMGGSDGYGQAAKHLFSELQNLGVKISIYQKSQKVGFLFHSPQSLLKLDNDFRIIYTMFESNKIPDSWIDFLKEADLVIVPSHWCMEVFGKSGINAEVIPLGYDDSVYGFLGRENKRENNKTFNFLHYNAFNVRKGFLELWKAFNKAFDPLEPVKLILKTTVNNPHQRFPYIDPIRNPNIEVISSNLNNHEMKTLMARSDCFVFPSMGEGFGLTPLEAMATGMSAIVPDAHGISEYFNSEYMYEVKVEKEIPAIYSRYKGMDVGNMYQSSVDDLARQMRYVYEHQDEALEKGKKASEYVKNWTYKKTAERLKEVFDKFIEKPVEFKPLRNVLSLERVA